MEGEGKIRVMRVVRLPTHMWVFSPFLLSFLHSPPAGDALGRHGKADGRLCPRRWAQLPVSGRVHPAGCYQARPRDSLSEGRPVLVVFFMQQHRLLAAAFLLPPPCCCLLAAAFVSSASGACLTSRYTSLAVLSAVSAYRECAVSPPPIPLSTLRNPCVGKCLAWNSLRPAC